MFQTVKLAGRPEEADDWLHRFRNFGEDVYLTLRLKYDIDIHEIDAAIDVFHVRKIPMTEVQTVITDLDQKLREHHLQESVSIVVDKDGS